MKLTTKNRMICIADKEARPPNRVARPAGFILRGEALTFINRNEMQVDHRTHSASLRAGKRVTHTAVR